MGSSAGGHLAASVSVHYDKKMYEDTDEIDKESCKPDATILCYPVIDMFEYRHDGSRKNLIGERSLHSDKELMSLYKHVTLIPFCIVFLNVFFCILTFYTYKKMSQQADTDLL